MNLKTISKLYRCVLFLSCYFFNQASGFNLPSVAAMSHVLEHLMSPPSMKSVSLEDLANTRIPGPSGIEIFARIAKPKSYDEMRKNNKALPVLIMIHEFFGLNQSIIDKARKLAEDLDCVVVAPDTFRGVVTDFIPRAIWLALTTPQSRVNDDLNAICSYVESNLLLSNNASQEKYKLAVMGFCYGGGKAIRYTTQCKNDAATVIFYGSPVTKVEDLQKLQSPICGIYGRNDAQFPMKLLDEFQDALGMAKVENDVQIYDDVGHAFWTDIDQINRGDQPQTAAYIQCTTFLKRFFHQE